MGMERVAKVLRQYAEASGGDVGFYKGLKRWWRGIPKRKKKRALDEIRRRTRVRRTR